MINWSNCPEVESVPGKSWWGGALLPLPRAGW